MIRTEMDKTFFIKILCFICNLSVYCCQRDIGDIDCSAEVYKTDCKMDEICSAHCLYPCHLRKSAIIWGTATYTYDSSICKSAVHDMRISTWNTSLRTVTFQRNSFYSFYEGSVRFGFSSSHYGKLGYRDRGSFVFLNSRVSEKILDVASVHFNYLYQQGENHSQSCFIRPKSRGVHFDAYMNREAVPGYVEKSPSSVDRNGTSLYQIIWPGIIPNLGGSGYQCLPSKSMLSIVTSVAMRKDAHFLPLHLTITANVNDSITISMREVKRQAYMTFWQKDSSSLNAYIQTKSERETLFLPNVQIGSAGIYSLEYSSAPDSIGRRGVTRLIVRVCPEWKYGDNCSKTCPDCLNGGICHDITGVCICPPGFSGNFCENACDPGSFGKACSMKCSDVRSVLSEKESCRGLLICLPDPYGCSCAAGYKGIFCNKVCEPGEYGAGCLLRKSCHCAGNESCDIFSGMCNSGCQDGWHGDGCVTSYPVLSNPPSVLNVTKDNILLSFSGWSIRTDEGFGFPQSYEIIFKESGKEEWLNGPTVLNKGSVLHNVTLNGLLPGRSYLLAVIVVDVSGEKQKDGLKSQIVVATECDKPTDPPHIVGTKVSESYVNISWELPPREKWNCQEIKVLLRFESSGFSEEVEIEGFASSYGFDSKSHVTWNITLCLKPALSRVPDATCSGVMTVTTDEGSPGQVQAIRVDSVESRSASLRWEEPQEKNGIIRYYVVHYWQTGWAHFCSLPFDTTDKTVNTTSASIILEDLRPSALYSGGVSAFTVEEGPISLMSFETSGEVPNAAPSIVKFQEMTNTLQWSAPYCNKTNGEITTYHVYTHGLDPWDTKERNYTTTELALPLVELVPYTNYMVEIFPANHFGLSVKHSELQFVTRSSAPPPPANVTVYNKSTNRLSLSWNLPYPPHGKLSHYIIQYKSSADDIFSVLHVNLSQTRCSPVLRMHKSCYTISGLKGNLIYRINLEAYNIAITDGSSPVTLTVNTSESIPDVPETIDVYERNDSAVKIMWTGPYITNGEIKSYRVNASLIESYTDPSFSFSVSELALVDEENFTLSNLLPASVYRLCIEAATSEGYGPALCTTFNTSNSVPIVQTPPRLLKVYAHGITIGLHPEMFLGRPISAYFVIVHHISKRLRPKRGVEPDLFLPVDCSSLQDDFPTKYTALKLDYLPNDGANVSIGDGGCSNGYYNAPLTAKGIYKVGVAVLSIYGMDHKYSEVKYIVKPIIVPDVVVRMEHHDVAAILGFLVPFLIAMIVVVLFIYYKRPEFLQKKYTRAMRMKILPKTEDSVFAISNAAMDENDVLETESISEEFSNCIPVRDLEEFVESGLKDHSIKREYLTLPRGQKFPCEMAKVAENKAKNRYGNLLPYDHSRVVLEPLDNVLFSDYINANYVDGYKTPRKYIASQGPKASTLGDFWRMIWQEGTRKILMATNIVEGGRSKCDKYWPDGELTESLICGGFIITFLNAQKYADFTIRTFQLCKNKRNGGREVKQFHFQSWPDHGVPPCASPVLIFLTKCRQYEPDCSASIVVHCSAGIGRTGTLVLLDSMLDMAKSENQVDLLGHLYRMRCQRSNIVENLDQYTFVYKALAETFCGINSRISCSDYLFKLKDLCREDEFGLTQIDREHEKLLKNCHTLSYNDTTTACLLENAHKNRDPSVLPPDRACPHLQDLNSSYINAVYVNSYTEKNAFIATQYPLPGTIDDFWIMIHQKGCRIITLLQEIDFSDPTCQCYWPTLGNMLCGRGYQVVCDSSIPDDDINTYNLTLSFESKNSYQVTLFHLHQWKPESEIPENTSSLVSLIQKIEEKEHQIGKNVLTIQCLNGAFACGLFCTALVLLDEIRTEHVVDVFQAAKLSKVNRPQFLQSLEQYKALYDIVEALLNFHSI